MNFCNRLIFINALLTDLSWERECIIMCVDDHTLHSPVGQGRRIHLLYSHDQLYTYTVYHKSEYTPHISDRTSLGDLQAEGGGVQNLKYLPALRCRHGGVEERSSGYLWSSGKLHAQESKGSSGLWWWPHKILTIDMVYVNIDNFL